MYKTLESAEALKQYHRIQFEVARINERHSRAMSKGHSITWFIVHEIFRLLFNQKLRSKAN
jgi:hypothetical protein